MILKINIIYCQIFIVMFAISRVTKSGIQKNRQNRQIIRPQMRQMSGADFQFVPKYFGTYVSVLLIGFVSYAFINYQLTMADVAIKVELDEKEKERKKAKKMKEQIHQESSDLKLQINQLKQLIEQNQAKINEYHEERMRLLNLTLVKSGDLKTEVNDLMEQLIEQNQTKINEYHEESKRLLKQLELEDSDVKVTPQTGSEYYNVDKIIMYSPDNKIYVPETPKIYVPENKKIYMSTPDHKM